MFQQGLGSVVASVLVLLGVVLGTSTVLTADRSRTGLERELDAAREGLREARIAGAADQVVLFDNLLPRVVERLRDVQKSSPDEVEAAHRVLVTHVIGQIQGYYSEDDDPVRVNYYRLRNPADPYLEIYDRTEYASREVLDGSTPEGRLIVTRVLGGDDVYCADLTSETARVEHVREEPRSHKYRCFASVVVRDGKDGYGMLSANTPVAAGLPESSVAFLSVFAGILASSEIIVGEIEPVPVGDRDVRVSSTVDR